MNDLLLFALIGLGEGALFAGVAISLVLFYKGSGVINISAGAVAMLTAYAFWSLRGGNYGHHFGTVPALIITLVFAVALGLITEFAAFRPLLSATPLAKLVASLGLLLFAQATVLIAFGPNVQNAPAILPEGTVMLLDTPIPVANLIMTGLVIACAALLAGVYRWTFFGLSVRASFENQMAAATVGVSPKSVSLANTVIGCVIAGALGVLAGPLLSLSPTTTPLIIVSGVLAALFARFNSFAIACAAGLAIGAFRNIMYYVSTLSWFPSDGGVPLPGIPELGVLVLMVIAMFLVAGRLPSRGDVIEQRLPAVPRANRIWQFAIAAAVAGALLLTVFPYDYRQALMNSLIGVVLALSMVVITGFVGQVSLVQLALSGGTGFIMTHLAKQAGIGFPLGPLLGVAGATACGVAIGVGALRVRGVQLVVVTLAGATAISQFWFVNPRLGGGLSGANVDQPHLFGISLGNDAGFKGLDGQLPSPVLGYGILAIAILMCVLVARLRKNKLGGRMLMVRSNERAAAGVGINVAYVKIVAFTISSFIAGVAGVLYAYDYGTVSANRFDALTALSVLAFAYIGGITTILGAVLAGLFAVEGLSTYSMQEWFGVSGSWVLLFGGWALLSNVVFSQGGIAGGIYDSRIARRLRRAREASRQRSGNARDELESPATAGTVP